MDKVTRVLILYHKLFNGERVYKDGFVKEYCIGERTFSRDIEDIRMFLGEMNSLDEVVYDRLTDSYYLMVDEPYWRRYFDDKVSMEQRKERMDGIVKIVAEHFDMTTSDIISKKKTFDVVYPRKLAMYLMKKVANCSIKEIQKMFSMDHTSTIYAINNISLALDREATRNDVDVLSEKIRNEVMV